MRTTLARPYALIVSAATLLAACGGSQPPIAPGGMVQTAPPQALPFSEHSIDDRAASRHHSKMIYVSDANSGRVEAYDYKSGSFLGAVTGFNSPYGLCSDRHGNVYVTDFSGAAYELKARTTTVIKSWQMGGYPIGCSVNPLNGDLAIAIYSECCGADSPGGVWIFRSGSSKGTFYIGPGWLEWPAGYDKNGNLFIECNQYPCSPSLAELPFKGSSYELLHLSGATLHFAAAVEWDGKYLGVGDQKCNGGYASCIYQTVVSGSTATVFNTVHFSCSGSYPYFIQWAEDAKHPNGQTRSPVKEVAAGAYGCASYSTSISVWPYPGGGSPVRTIPLKYGAIDGATIIE